MERILEIRGAYNLRGTPPQRDFGIHNMVMFFAVKGPAGGVSISMSTNWYLPSEQRSQFAMYTKGYPWDPVEKLMQPSIDDVCVHSKEEQYPEQYHRDGCVVTGGTCYSDGSSLWGNESWRLGFLHGGSDWLFEKMEDYYRNQFEGGPPVDLTPIPQRHPDEGKL